MRRRLYRDSTLYKGGKHLRDLSKLNRDLSKVLLITSDPDAYEMHPNNTIKVPPASLSLFHAHSIALLSPMLAVESARMSHLRRP